MCIQGWYLGDSKTIYYDKNFETGALSIKGYGEIQDFQDDPDLRDPDLVDSPFYKDKSIKSVYVGEGITKIGKYTFYGCSNLECVSLPQSLRVIGDISLAYCTNLSQIKLSGNIETICYGAFSGCKNLKKIFFDGSRSRWEEIKIEQGNEAINDAEIIFGR